MSGNAYSRTALTNVFPIPDDYKTTADDYLMISTPFYGQVVGIEEPLGLYRIHNSNQWAYLYSHWFGANVAIPLQKITSLQS